MKIGILGTGFGAYHASIYNKLAGVEIVKIFGRNKEKLNKLGKDLNINVTNNIEEIICDPGIDVVDVCLPSSLHKKYVIEAFKNGKNVFCETPITLSLEDAVAIKEAELKYKKRVFVNLFIKFEFPYIFLNEAVLNNTYGKLKALHIKRKTPPLWGDLGLNKISTNLMIHEFDIITHILDEPNTVFARGVSSKENQCHVDALLDYKDVIVEVQGSSMMPHYHPFTVGYDAVFEEGTIEFIENGYASKSEKSLIVFTNDEKKEIKIPEENCYKKCIQHFIDCCKTEKETVISIDHAIKSLNLALQIKKLICKLQ